MSRDTQDPTDRMIRLERRGIWLALLIILLLGAVALIAGTTQDSALARQAQWMMSVVIPMTIVIGAAWVGRRQGNAAPESKERRKAILGDELRLVATYKAFRAGFLAMLLALAASFLLTATNTLIWSAGLLAATTCAFGIAVFLGAFLFYDRA